MEIRLGAIIWVKLKGIIFPAIVHTVHSQECISVNAFTFEGVVPMGSVLRSENCEAEYSWDWMPYQKDRAIGLV